MEGRLDAQRWDFTSDALWSYDRYSSSMRDVIFGRMEELIRTAKTEKQGRFRGSVRRRTPLARFAFMAAVVLAAALLQSAGGSPAVAAPSDPTLPNQVLSPTAPPTIVYRLDTRPPAVIFQTGFEPWYDDTNIVRHVNGNPLSAYVSTTTDPNMYREFAPITFDLDNITDVWVYRIRATSNFYNTAGSLDYLRRLPSISPDNRALVERTYRDFERQHEWSALGHVPATQIIDAGRLNRDILADAPITANVMSLLRNTVPNYGFVIDSTRGNYNLITNENYTGIEGSNLPASIYDASWFGNCTAPRSTRAEACALGGFTLRPPQDLFDGKEFAIRPIADPGRALEVAQTQNQPVVLYQAHEFSTQAFIPERDSNRGLYRLRSDYNGRYLTGATPTVYANATYASATLWSFERQDDGWFRIVAHGETFRDQLTMNNPGSVQMTASDSNWGDWNRWSISPIGDPLNPDQPYQIKPLLDRSKVLQAAGANPPGGANVSIANLSFDLNARWFPTYDVGKGAYKFRNGATGNYNLAWEDSWGSGRTNVVVWDGNHDDQYWILRKNIAGFDELVNFRVQASGSAANYKVLDLAGSQTAPGANVGVSTYHGGQNQQWVVGQFLRK